MIQRLKLAVFILAAGTAWLAPAAKADEWDKRTVLTFNEAVEIPGKVLTAGTYVFKLAEGESDRTVVQVFTQDEQHLVATVIAVPSYRIDPADKTIVTFEERPSGSPEALHKWFYPGDNFGLEFVYPKSETQVAVNSEQPVLLPAVAVAPPPEPTTARIEAAPAMPEIVPEPEVETAEIIPMPIDNAPAAEIDSPPSTLPQTAGNFAMIPLLGIALLSGGLAAIRSSARRG